MPLQLAEVTSDSDFDRLIPLLWLSYESPRILFLPLLFPLDDESASAREKAVQRTKETMMHMHHADPSSHWLKVTDTDTAQILAGARWHVHEVDPYSSAPEKPFVVTSWPEGDRRRYATMNIGQVILPRMKRYRNPHLNLQVCFTHTDQRRRGAGKLIMDWGVKKADDLGLQSFIEATETGRHLYEKYGFVVVSVDTVDTSIPEPSDEWKDMERRFRAKPWYCMWRPVKGHYEEGKTVLPW